MDGGGLVGIILPFALGLFISFALMSASSYLLRAVADEKESRTIEIMTTSVSPEQLIAGKAVGLVGVALTQVFLWALVVLGGLAVASNFVDSLRGMEISWSLVLVLAVYFVPSVHSGGRDGRHSRRRGDRLPVRGSSWRGSSAFSSCFPCSSPLSSAATPTDR